METLSQKLISQNYNSELKKTNYTDFDYDSLIQYNLVRTREEIEKYDKPIKESPFQIDVPRGLFAKPIKEIVKYIAKGIFRDSVKVEDSIEKIVKDSVKEHNDRYRDGAGFRNDIQRAVDKGEHKERMEKITGKETDIA